MQEIDGRLTKKMVMRLAAIFFAIIAAGCQSGSNPVAAKAPNDVRKPGVSIHLPPDWKVVDMKSPSAKDELIKAVGDDPKRKEAAEIMQMLAVFMNIEVMAFGPNKGDGSSPSSFTLYVRESEVMDVNQILINDQLTGMFGRIEKSEIAPDPPRVHQVSNMEMEGRTTVMLSDLVPVKGKHYIFAWDFMESDRDAMTQLAEQVVRSAKFE